MLSIMFSMHQFHLTLSSDATTVGELDGLWLMLVLVQCWVVDCSFVRPNIYANGKTGGGESYSRAPATSEVYLTL